MLIAAITADTVDAWTAIVLRIIEMVGVVALACITVWSRTRTAVLAERIDRHGQKLSSIESDMTSLAMATPPAPPVVPPVPAAKATLDYEKLAKLLAESMKKINQ